MFKVEKGIEYNHADATSRNAKYPFKEMEIGDSFAINKDIREKVRIACYNHGMRNGKLFKVGFDKSGCLRCWRLE